MNDKVKVIAKSPEVDIAIKTYLATLFQNRRDILEKFKDDPDAQAAYMIAWASVCMAEAMNCFRAGGAGLPLMMAQENVKAEIDSLERRLVQRLSNGG